MPRAVHNAPWTSETAPRNGGRRKDGKPKVYRVNPKVARDEAEQYLLLNLPRAVSALVRHALKYPGGRAMALFLERAMPLLKDTDQGKIILQKITLELDRGGEIVALPGEMPRDAERCQVLPEVAASAGDSAKDCSLIQDLDRVPPSAPIQE